VQTRRDQLHAYRFMTRRAMSALVTGEPDTVEPPMRRLTIMTISGVMIAIVVAAAFAVIGLLRPGGGDDWQEDGTVVIERETGARYVVVAGELRPALNYASAVLASQSNGEAAVELVPRDKLDDLERGTTIGTPGLPDSMPSAEELIDGPVAVCSRPADSDSATVSTEVEVFVGTSPDMELVPEGQAILAQKVGDKAQWLLANGRRHQIANEVVSSLGIGGRPAVVGGAFLSAIPEGDPLKPPRIDGIGQAPQGVQGANGLKVGQVIEVSGGGGFRVLLKDGIATISSVEARLIERAANSPGPARSMASSELPTTQATASWDAVSEQTDDLPAELPSTYAAAAAVHAACAVLDDEGALTLAVPEVEYGGSEPSAEGVGSATGDADVVTMKPGAALLAKSRQGKGVYLVAEPGRAYPAASQEVLAGFGYAETEPVVLTDDLIGILPDGPAFNPQEALAEARS
jgi:type VII secretion protein EccB